MIAYGSTQLSEIYSKTRIEKSKISVYIKNLIDLRILEREFPVFSKTSEQASSTRGLYRVADNFFRFWFRYVCPSLTDLEIGDVSGVFAHMVQPQLNDFASYAFEHVCREFLRYKSRNGETPFRLSKIGRWWGKLNVPVTAESGHSKLTSVASEIDIIAADNQLENYILGECKFRNSRMDVADLVRLREKTLPMTRGAAVHYALFSKSGFTKGLIEHAEGDDRIHLYTLDDVFEL